MKMPEDETTIASASACIQQLNQRKNDLGINIHCASLKRKKMGVSNRPFLFPQPECKICM